MPAKNIALILIALLVSLVCYRRAAHNRYATAISEVIGEVDQFYVEEVDRRELFENSMRGLMRHLDPYSGFADSEQYQQLLEGLDQEFGGVGIMVDVDPDTNRLMVLSPLPGSPAYDAGMRAGDLILKIEGDDTTGLNASDSVNLIRGPPGSPVQLTILPLGTETPRDVTLQRAIIPIESVLGDRRREDGGWDYVLTEHPEIGYLRIANFGENTGNEVAQVLSQLKGQIQGMILDLRNNPGGLLTAAVDVCDLFLDSGVIVSVNGRGGLVQQSFSASPGTIVPADFPLVVLIDKYSASASEIVSACLQDHERATVIGERSFGKGTVQTVIELEGGRSAMRLTTATYWRPSGKNIHRLPRAEDNEEWGVTPDAGYLVEFEEAEMLAVWKRRRERDVVLSRRNGNAPQDGSKEDEVASEMPAHDQTPAPSTENEASAATSADSPVLADAPEEPSPPVVDRQLNRAVECIEASLQRHSAAA